MAYTQEQIDREIEISKMVLRNTIARSDDSEITKNAKTILQSPVLLRRFAINRLNRKGSTTNKPSLISRALGWFGR